MAHEDGHIFNLCKLWAEAHIQELRSVSF